VNPLSKPINLPSIALDIGFISTKFSLGRREADGGKITVRQFPSLAPRISASAQTHHSGDELDGVMIELAPGVRHFVGQDVYRMVNAPGTRAVTDDYSQTGDYRALFLGALFHIARELSANTPLVIETLVAGLPLSTVYTHSAALKEFIAGEHTIPHPAHLDQTLTVTVRKAMVIAQPQGALIAHGIGSVSKSKADFNTLVLDMGGGTFDWFVAQGLKPNRARCGATPIGALACATAICNEIDPNLKHDAEIMARVDTALRTGAPMVRITGIEHPMAKFEQVVKGVLQDAIEQMRKSVGSLNNIDRILVTGGGAPLMHKALREALPKFQHLLEVDQEPVFSNVRGFHVLGEYQAQAQRA
jgi:plasmid segregation protein ParM